MSLGLDFVVYQKILQTQFKMPEAQATAFALAGYRDNIRLFDKLSGVTSSTTAIINSAVVAAAVSTGAHGDPSSGSLGELPGV